MNIITANILDVKVFRVTVIFGFFTFRIFFLSEHITFKKNIVIVKKFDFEILAYLYILGSSEFIYSIVTVINVCVCACVYVIDHDSV